MFRFFKIAAVVFVVLVVIAAFWLNQRNVNAAQNGVKGPVEYDFPQGGTIRLDLSAGDYEIRGTADNKIRVRYTYSEYMRDTASIAAKVNGDRADIAIDGPSNHFRVEIEVPQKSHLTSDFTAGKFSLTGVEGNKDISANAGKVDIDLGSDPASFKEVEASIVSGNLVVRPWHARRGGLFRSFERHNASGTYSLRAHLMAGKLTLEGNRTTTLPEVPKASDIPEPPKPPKPDVNE